MQYQKGIQRFFSNTRKLTDDVSLAYCIPMVIAETGVKILQKAIIIYNEVNDLACRLKKYC